MKLRRIAFIATAAVMAFTANVTLVACKNDATVVSVDIVEEGLRTTYYVGETIDYSKINLEVTYSNDKTETLHLESRGVTHTQIDTTKVGAQELTATYKEKSDTVSVTVSAQTEPEDTVVTLFALPERFTRRQTEDDPNGVASEDRSLLLKGVESYKVGDDNGFVFVPDARKFDVLSPGVGVAIDNVLTTYKLLVEGENGEFTEAADPAALVTTKEDQPNVYYFSEAAVGLTVRLQISISERYDTSMLGTGEDTVTAELEIIDGYNVYDQDGLSVFDSLNVKHWAELKDKQLDWDERKLSEYNTKENPVQTIVLHNNITINPDLLPDNFFWDKDRDWGDGFGNQGYNTVAQLLRDKGEGYAQYAEILNGSLRDSTIGEDGGIVWAYANGAGKYQEETYAASDINMQKGLYVTAHTNLTGNGMRISYTLQGAKHGLYSVFDNTQSPGLIVPHYSMFKYVDSAVVNEDLAYKPETEDCYIENVRLVGQMARLAQTSGEPAQLMAFNPSIENLTLDNVFVTQFFCAVTGDQHDGKTVTNIVDSKLMDFFSNMTYSWRTSFNIERSIMVESGGPVFVLCDGNREGEANDDDGPQLNVDDVSRIESLADGNEPWYSNLGIGTYFRMFTDNSENGILRPNVNKIFDREFVQQREDKAGELINVIAAIVPEPINLLTDYNSNDEESDNYTGKKPLTSGRITRTHADYVENFEMNPSALLANDTVRTLFDTTPAPFFYSGKLVTIYAPIGATVLSIAMKVEQGNVVETASTATSVHALWTEPTNVSDWLMLTLRSDIENGLSSVRPRFGILVGGVTSYTTGK